MFEKDHGDSVKFLGLFQRLREVIDDDPSGLEALAADDEPLKKLCLDVGNAALPISLAESGQRELFTGPVDPIFIREWRVYEERYAATIGQILLADLIGMDLNRLDPVTGSELERRRKFAADSAREEACAIEEIFAIAGDAAPYWSDQDVADSFERGTEEWSKLVSQVGFDLEGTFRRRKLIPFVLIPRHVSDYYGGGESLSLLTHLRQAHEAFVYGVPFAALALMRSILELVLKMHYQATGKDLTELIDSAKSIPQTVSKAKLHRLRMLANDILHVNRQSIRLPSSQEELEREVLSFLLLLRTLIEGAPRGQRANRGWP